MMKKNLLRPSLYVLSLMLSLCYSSHVFSQCDSTISGLEVGFLDPSGLCVDDGLQTGLTGGFPEGGIYSGPGVTDDGNGQTFRFDPALAGVGTQTLIYSYDNIPLWTQTGQKIVGTFVFPGFGEEALPDGTGEALALSADGNTLAVGAKFRDDGNFEGAVEVYDWNGNTWTLRPLLSGESGFSRFGSTVSLSADGNRLAVSAPTSSPESFIRVWDWDGTGWTQVGQDILGEVSTLQLSSDGNRLLKRSSIPLSTGGSITVYEWNGSNWGQIGQAISGTNANQRIGENATLSGDGNIIAVGEPENSVIASAGRVQVFAWDGTDWMMRETLLGSIAEDRLGKSVALSTDGARLAVGNNSKLSDGSNPGKVFVYQWNGSTYQALAGELVGLVGGDDFGASISLSGNGNRLVVGSRGNDQNGIGSGLMQVFDWDGNEWVQIGGDILGEDPALDPNVISDDGLGSKVAISSDGSRVAGGKNGLSDLDFPQLGFVIAYDLGPSSVSCAANAQIRVEECNGCEKINFALGKPTETPCDYGNSSSDLGVDGITEGNSPWRNPDIVHTCVPFKDPWWQVDLQEEVGVSEICVYNRNSPNQSNVNRLTNYHLFVSTRPFDPDRSLQELLGDNSIFHVLVEETAGFPSCIPIPETKGRYVRIQLEGNKILNFAEIEVLGCKQSGCTTPSNLALQKEASQSSVYGFGVASIAVDGDQDGSRGPWRNPSIQHTQRENQPWWEINLGQAAAIQEVVIYNRTDCCMGRLKDFYVFASSNPINADLSIDVLTSDPTISSEFFSGRAGGKERISFSNTEAQYVVIKLSGMGILHMAEVEVLGCFIGGSSTSARFANVDASPERSPNTTFELNVSPNPFSESLSLETEREFPEGSYAELVNTLGQLMGKYPLTGSIHTIDTRELPVGIYFLQIPIEEKLQKYKVVKTQ